MQLTQLHKVAEQGNRRALAAQRTLGDIYYEGRGVPKDYIEAAKWFRKVAEQGDTCGQYKLGLMYYKGEGVPQDYREAVKWFRKAAERNTWAQRDLGLMYYKGEGVPQDYQEAVKWFRKAAEQSADLALWSFGPLYFDSSEGFDEKWKRKRKAAELILASLQHRLGLMYYKGEGILEDYVEAYAWMILAASKGYKRAAEFKEKLRSRMTIEQVAEAQKLAAELFKCIESSKPE